MFITGGAIVGCNNDSNSNSSVIVKDESYFKNLAAELVAKMTLSEKISLLAGPGPIDGVDTPAVPNNLKGDSNIGVAGYINGIYNEKSGLDIAASKLADGPAGVRIPPSRTGSSGTYYATAWPIGTQLASTWNKDLVEQVGDAFGDEAQEYGIDFMLAPGMNIQRNPLNGRNFEYFSEDPIVTGLIGSAMINGLQKHVGATMKHFAAYNSSINFLNIDNIVTPRALREIYLKGFQIAMKESHPWALMSSYNKVNGEYASENKDLLVSVLRDEWGYNGIAMTDWNAGNSFKTPNTVINAGSDLIEPGANPMTKELVVPMLETAVSTGELKESAVTSAAEHIISQVLKTPSYNNYSYSNNPDLNAHAKLARNAADEGMVLLKNSDSSLPIASNKKVALFGINQLVTYKGGTGSGNVNSAYTVNILNGISNKFTIDSDLSDYYQNYYDANKVKDSGDAFSSLVTYSCSEPSINDDVLLQNLVSSSAQNDDVAVISIGRVGGEGTEFTVNDGYYLTDKENALIDAVYKAFNDAGKKVIFVLNVPGVIDTARWSDKADSILLAYMGGQDIGNSVADILSGDVNPSGKLTQTFPKQYTDIPSATSYSGADIVNGSPTKAYYSEGIYVGYRYYSTLNKDVSYPFGWGLSYTTFNYSDPTVTSNTLNGKGKNGVVSLTVNVTNAGDVAGKEAVQVYISAPEVKLKKPAIELKAFAKTEKLNAGGSQKLTFNIPAYILASFDEDNNQWIIEPGTYKAYISASSDISGVAPISFTVDKQVVVEDTTPGALALPSGLSDTDVLQSDVVSLQ